MSVPHIILDSLPSLCQKLSDLVWWKFDIVIKNIFFYNYVKLPPNLTIFGNFLRHGVEFSLAPRILMVSENWVTDNRLV